MRVIGGGLVVGSLGAVGWFAFRATQSNISFADVRWVTFVGAILLQLTALSLLPVFWVHLLGFVWPRGGSDPGESSRLALYRAFGRSWLARYIPGRIWMFGGRLVLARELGVSAQAVARSMALEIVLSYGMLIILGTTLIISAEGHFLAGGGTLVIGTAALVLGIPAVQRVLASVNPTSDHNSFWHRVRRLTSTLFVEDSPLSLRNSVWGVTVYGLHACLELGAIVVLTESLVDLTFQQSVAIAGAWAMSVTLGYVSFLAPAGLGVRDGVALLLLSRVLDVTTAGLVVATSRIMMIGTDLGFVALVELLVFGLGIGKNTGKSRIVAPPSSTTRS